MHRNAGRHANRPDVDIVKLKIIQCSVCRSVSRRRVSMAYDSGDGGALQYR
jgi:hypothetical protein